MASLKTEKIKVNFTDFWPNFNIYTSFFYKLLVTKYEVEIDENPDILFYSVHSNNHQRYNCTKILFTGENIRPDFNDCDFSFSFDYPITAKNYRLPLYALYDDVNKLINHEIDSTAELKNKTKFCCFIVSNPSCEIRNNFFLNLSKHKHVDSAGSLYNNVGGNIENKREFIKQYKFVIAFENSNYPGYVTEKIFEPLLEDCVPIYWGTELVNKDFNTKRFINCNDFENFDAVIQHVLAVDADDEVYLKYLNEPVFKDDQLPSFLENENILAQLAVIIEYSQKKSIKQTIRQHTRPYLFLLKKLLRKLKK
jgi:hypothetical protein